MYKTIPSLLQGLCCLLILSCTLSCKPQPKPEVAKTPPVVAKPGQANQTFINTIRKEVSSINGYKDLKKVVLTNEEFLDHTPDGGGELTGLYSDGKLKKIICWVGLSFGTEIFEYYFKDDKLIFIYEQFNTFVFDEKKQALHYDQTEKTFEGRYYFNGSNLIDQITTGHNRFEDDAIDPEKTLMQEAESYKRVLTSKNKKDIIKN